MIRYNINEDILDIKRKALKTGCVTLFTSLVVGWLLFNSAPVVLFLSVFLSLVVYIIYSILMVRNRLTNLDINELATVEKQLSVKEDIINSGVPQKPTGWIHDPSSSLNFINPNNL